MPNKKSKSSASRGRTAASSSSATPSQQLASSSSSSAPAAQSEEFKAKNARAKALIMSTLAPGSEPWKIAESLELASDIWKALEEKYAPKERGSGSGGVTNTNTGTSSGKTGVASRSNTADGGDKKEIHKKLPPPPVSSSDFIGDWVEGKPLDKYLDLYKSDILAKAKSDLGKVIATANVKLGAQSPHNIRPDQLPVPDNAFVLARLKELLAMKQAPGFPQSGLPTNLKTAHSTPQAVPKAAPSPRPAPPAPSAPSTESASPAQPAQPAQPAPPTLSAPPPPPQTHSPQWIASPVRHDSYLSESQALTFASGDLERKKQIQAAATKVLMQKLPTRDLRFLWALLYGGDDAPWPGSWSTVIPGVTQAAAQLKDLKV
ncbi:hypothetical protein ABEF95_013176 [Exophiala dermatitidis]